MRKEKLSSFMDGELVDDDFIASLSSDKEMQSIWHRYHLSKDALQNTLHPQTFSIDISAKVAAAIADLDIEPIYQDQPAPESLTRPTTSQLLWPKFKDMFARVGQVGLAACVTLSVIAGVQYYSSQAETNANPQPAFSTTPIGLNVSPVGGIHTVIEPVDNMLSEKQLTQEQYEKIYLMLQDYELQKRLNANR